MKISGYETNEVILKEIGARIKDRRVSLMITQKELSEESDVSIRTIVNVESGQNVSLENLISIMRVLKVADNLDLLVPELKTNPFDILELGHKRKRARKKEKHVEWKWGDEK